MPPFPLGKSLLKIDWWRMLKIHKFWSRYLVQYKRDINKNIVEKSADYCKEAHGQINLIFETLALSSTGYTVLSC